MRRSSAAAAPQRALEMTATRKHAHMRTATDCRARAYAASEARQLLANFNKVIVRLAKFLRGLREAEAETGLGRKRTISDQTLAVSLDGLGLYAKEPRPSIDFARAERECFFRPCKPGIHGPH